MKIYIETERLILREYEPGDFESYYHLKSHKDTMFYLPELLVTNRRQAKQDFEEILADQKEEKRQFYFFHMEEK